MIVAPCKPPVNTAAVAPVLVVPPERPTVTGSVPTAVDSTRPKPKALVEGTSIDVLGTGAISNSFAWYSNW